MNLPTLNSLQLVNIAIAADPAYQPQEGNRIQIANQLIILHSHDPKSSIRQVLLKCTLARPADDKPVAFTGEISGSVDVDYANSGAASSQAIDEAAAFHAGPIIVGAIRGWINTITGMGPYPRVLLNWVDIESLIANAWVIKSDSQAPEALYPEGKEGLSKAMLSLRQSEDRLSPKKSPAVKDKRKSSRAAK